MSHGYRALLLLAPHAGLSTKSEGGIGVILPVLAWENAPNGIEILLLLLNPLIWKRAAARFVVYGQPCEESHKTRDRDAEIRRVSAETCRAF